MDPSPHVDVAIEQYRAQAACCDQEGHHNGKAAAGQEEQQHGDQGQGGLQTEELSLADVGACRAGNGVKSRGESQWT
jgi:hypothetical protein